MNISDFKKLVKGYSAEDITYDDPHVPMRCNENSITLEEVKKTLLNQDANLIRIVRDRPDVYKVYYHMSRKRELKIVIDLFTHKKINIRTVKVLDSRFRLGSIKRQRF